MAQDKKLRISEESEGKFILEQYDEGDNKWVTLNKEGGYFKAVYAGQNNLITNKSEKTYTSIDEAKNAFNGFMTFPRVVFYEEGKCDKESIHCDFTKNSKLNVIPISELKEVENKIPEVKSAFEILSKLKEKEALAEQLCIIEKRMSCLVRDLNLKPFNISLSIG